MKSSPGGGTNGDSMSGQCPPKNTPGVRKEDIYRGWEYTRRKLLGSWRGNLRPTEGAKITCTAMSREE